MSVVKFGDVVKEVKINIDRSNNPYQYYVAGDHMDSEDLTIRRKGLFATDDVGPAFIRLFKPGQVLYGSRRTYLKKVAVADFEGVCSNTTFVLETKDECVLRQRLLPFIMLTDEFTKWSVSKSKGSTNPYILFSDLANYEFDLPDVHSQDQLVELLWQAYATKESYLEMIRATDEMVKSQFIEMFGTIKSPSACDVMTVGDAVERGIIEKPMDGNHGSKHPTADEYVDSGIPFLLANNITEEGVDLMNCSFITKERALRLDKGFAHNGDVLLTHKGTVGRVAILNCPNYDFVMLTPQVTYYRPLKGLSAEYLKAYFESQGFQEEIMSIASSGATRAYIGITEQRKLHLLIPNTESQCSFVTIVKLADKSKFELKQAIEKIDKLMRALMQ